MTRLKKLLSIPAMLIIFAMVIVACGNDNNQPSSFTVTLTQGTGYSIVAKNNASTTISRGGSFTFVVVLDAAYTQSTPSVRVNNIPVSLTNLEFTISNITSNQNVTIVGGLALNNYVVSLPQTQTGFSLTAKDGMSTTVEHGGDFTFVFELDSAYSQASTPSVKVNNVEVLDADGEYTIENITGARSVTVSGIGGLNNYSLNLTFVNLTNGTTHDAIEVTGNNIGGFESGDTANLSITENPGFEFVRWTGDIESTNRTIQFTVTGDMALEIEYEMIPYDVVFMDGVAEVERLQGVIFGEVITVPGMNEIHDTLPAIFVGFRDANNEEAGANLNASMIELEIAGEIIYDASYAEVILNFEGEGFNFDAGTLLTRIFVERLGDEIGTFFDAILPDGENTNPGYKFVGWEFNGTKIANDNIFEISDFAIRLNDAAVMFSGVDWIAEISFQAIWEANEARAFFWFNFEDKDGNYTEVFLNGLEENISNDDKFINGTLLGEALRMAHVDTVGPLPSEKLQVAADEVAFENINNRFNVQGWVAAIDGELHIFAAGNNQVATETNKKLLLQWAHVHHEVLHMITGDIDKFAEFTIKAEFENNFHRVDDFEMVILNNITGGVDDIHFFAIYSL